MLDFFYPSMHKLSGAERVVVRLAEYLVRGGQTVRIVTQYISPVIQELLPAGVLVEVRPLYRLTDNHYWNSLREFVASAFLMNHRARDTSAICFFGAPSLPGLVRMKHASNPSLACLHFCFEPLRALYQDDKTIRARVNPMLRILWPLLSQYRFFDRYAVRQADALMTVSHFSAHLIQQTYGRCATPITLGPGVTIRQHCQAEITQLRRTYGLSQENPVILTVNSLHPRKAIDRLLRALPMVCKHNPNVRAVIVGTGPERARLVTLCQSLDIQQRVIFTGYVPDDALSTHYAMASIYVHTTRNESLGTSVIEAAFAGLPIVAVREGGVGETVVHGETGLLIEPDPSVISQSILSLLSDTQRASRMGAKARERALRVNRWETAVEEFLRVANDVR